jgi:hypothetical protein
MRWTAFLAICCALVICGAAPVRAQDWQVDVMQMEQMIRIGGSGIILAPTSPVLPIAATADAKSDRITSRSGTNLPCRILSIEPDGSVRFKVDWLKGESSAQMKDLQRITLGGKGGRGGRDVLLILNGDVLEATLKGMTDETVTIESSFMGRLQLPHGAVRRIECATESSGFAGKDFADGDLGPWKPCNGTWKVTDGRLHAEPIRQDFAIAMPLEQKGSMTYEFKIAAVSASVRYQAILFADSTENNGYAPNSIRVRIYSTSVQVRMYDSTRGSNSMGAFSCPNIYSASGAAAGAPATIRIACDLEKKFITVWVNGNQIGKRAMPWRPKDGKFLVLRSQYGERTEYVRVYKGVVPPLETGEGQADKDRHLLVLANGDRFRSPTLTLTGPGEGETVGRFLANVAGTEVPVPQNRVSRLMMPTQSHAPPRRCKGDARVRTGRGVITMQITGLDDEFLTGKSDYLGELKIPREAVRRLDLSIYASP